MSSSNGNGNGRAKSPPVVRCERALCKVANSKLGRLGLCDEHFDELCRVGAENFAWKKHATKRARDEAGKFISILDEEHIETALGMLKATGLELESASFAGISRESWHRWMRDGRSDQPNEMCLRLVLAVEDAISQWELGVVGAILKDADARTRLDLLKHHPRTKQKWAPVARTEIANAPGETFRTKHTLDLSGLSLEEKRQMAALLEKGGVQADEDIIDAEVIELPQRAGGE